MNSTNLPLDISIKAVLPPSIMEEWRQESKTILKLKGNSPNLIHLKKNYTLKKFLENFYSLYKSQFEYSGILYESFYYFEQGQKTKSVHCKGSVTWHYHPSNNEFSIPDWITFILSSSTATILIFSNYTVTCFVKNINVDYKYKFFKIFGDIYPTKNKNLMFLRISQRLNNLAPQYIREEESKIDSILMFLFEIRKFTFNER